MNSKVELTGKLSNTGQPFYPFPLMASTCQTQQRLQRELNCATDSSQRHLVPGTRISYGCKNLKSECGFSWIRCFPKRKFREAQEARVSFSNGVWGCPCGVTAFAISQLQTAYYSTVFYDPFDCFSTKCQHCQGLRKPYIQGLAFYFYLQCIQWQWF